MPTLNLKGNNPYRAIRWNGLVRVNLSRSVTSFTVRYMDGQEENIDLSGLKAVLTEADMDTYAAFINDEKMKGVWVEIEGHPYCEARR